jgi:hypothetical protein
MSILELQLLMLYLPFSNKKTHILAAALPFMAELLRRSSKLYCH